MSYYLFISKPYEECPKCKKIAFGRLNVSGNSYNLKCGECGHIETRYLPEISKKVVYLDQFVISNLMMAINKKLNKKVDKWYLELFNKLEYAVGGQVIICPYSDLHDKESTPFHFQEMKRMYEHFAHGIKLEGLFNILTSQTFHCFDSWINNKTPEYDLSIDSILQRGRKEWHDTIYITLDKEINDEEIIKYNEYLQSVHQNLLGLIDKWKVRKENYDYFYQEESNDTGKGLIESHVEYMKKYAKVYLSKGKRLDVNDYLELSFSQPINSFIYLQLEKKTKEEDIIKSTKILGDFLKSDAYKNMPYNQISASLWATIRYQYSKGQRVQPVSKGTFNDIDMLSLYLPYIDAMIIDKDMYHIAKYGENKNIMGKYHHKLFSQNNKEEFILYIDNLCKGLPRYHFKIVENVYGKDWNKPYTTMYENKFKKK